MEKNLSQSTLKAITLPENKIGKICREQLNAMCGEELTAKLLHKDTMMTTFQGEMNSIYADNSIVDKELAVRKLAKPVITYASSWHIVKLAERLGYNGITFNEICNEGVCIMYNLVNRLPIKLNPKTNEMCFWTLGSPEKPSTVIKSFKNYCKRFAEELKDYVMDNTDVGMDNRDKIIKQQIRKAENEHFTTREGVLLTQREKTAYIISQINNHPRCKNVTESEVNTVRGYGTSNASMDDVIAYDNGDSKELKDTLEDKKSRFEGRALDRVCGENNLTESLRNIIEVIDKLAEKGIKGRELSKEKIKKLYIAYYNVQVIEKLDKELKPIMIGYMNKCLPSFSEIIEEYGNTYDKIEETYKRINNIEDINQQAISEQARRLMKKVEKGTKELEKEKENNK